MGVAVSEAEMENVPNPTLIRIRGEFVVRLSAEAAAGSQTLLSMGLIIQSARAIAAGVGGMPVPFGGIASDWIWHRNVPLSSGAGGLNPADPGQNTRFEVDNKSMRKFDFNQGLVLVIQNSVITSTATVEVVGGLRILFKR